MDLSISIGVGGWIVLVSGAIVFGVFAQLVGETETDYEWLLDGFAALVGAIVASELVTAWRTVEPVYDGLALLPALVGGLVLGLIVELATRYLTGGTYTQAHTPA
jgi:uncharacterized membrane protein YeaQ/YmgE (transglycosylase-associated protein family)